MLAIGQKVVMVSSSEDVAQTLRKCKKKFRGRVVYINRDHRWFTVEYKARPGAYIRESFSFYELGNTVSNRFRKKAGDNNA